MQSDGVRRWVGMFVAAFALMALSPASRAESDTQLVERFDQAESAGNYDDALSAALAIVQRHPTAAQWCFNAARMHARLGHGDEAIVLLQRCADGGYTGIASFEEHADLDPVRKRPEFAAIIAKVRANAEKRMAEFQAEALKHTHPVYVPRSITKNAKPPVIIALHGTGGTGAQMVSALRRTCDELGMICMAPDAMRPAANGFSWTYRDESAWLVEHMIDVAVKEHNGDPTRVYLVGFSQGANISLAMTQTHAERFAGVIPVCGHYEPHAISGDGKGAVPAPTYLISGSRDPWNQTNTQAKADFTSAGGAAEVRIVPGMGHEMASPAELKKALEWCAAHAAE